MTYLVPIILVILLNVFINFSFLVWLTGRMLKDSGMANYSDGVYVSCLLIPSPFLIKLALNAKKLVNQENYDL